MNTTALVQAAARTNAQKSENDTQNHHGMSRILKKNPAAALAQRYLVDCIEVWHDIMMDPQARHRDRLEAARLLVERGYGKPATVAQEVIESAHEIPVEAFERIDLMLESREFLGKVPPEQWPAHIREFHGVDDGDCN